MPTKPSISAETLQALADEGLTQTKAAERLGKPLSTVTHRASAYGISFNNGNVGRPIAGPTDDELRAMAASGLTMKDVVEQSDVSHRTIKRRASALGVKFKRPSRAPHKKAPVTVGPKKPPLPRTLAEAARMENAAMRERCFNK